MALVTASDVKSAAKTYHVGILLQSNDDLTVLITVCQADLERQTGRVFEEIEKVDSMIGCTGRLIQLDHYPIKSIDEVLIDNSEYDIDSDEYNLQTGQILFSVNPLYSIVGGSQYSYQVTYTTDIPDDAALAKDILCRMVLDKVKNRESTVTDDIKRLKRTAIGSV